MILSENQKKKLVNACMARFGATYVIESVVPVSPIPRKDWEKIKRFEDVIRREYSWDDPIYTEHYRVYNSYSYEQREAMNNLEGYKVSYVLRPKDKRSANGDRFPKFMIQEESCSSVSEEEFINHRRYSGKYDILGLRLIRFWGRCTTLYKEGTKIALKEKFNLE